MEAIPRKILNYRRSDGTEPMKEWLVGLRDHHGKERIIDRLERLELGNLGRTEKVGDGVLELKVNVGPGYRIYCGQDGPVLVVLLCGGDKSTQKRKDIEMAKGYWADYKMRKA